MSVDTDGLPSAGDTAPRLPHATRAGGDIRGVGVGRGGGSAGRGGGTGDYDDDAEAQAAGASIELAGTLALLTSAFAFSHLVLLFSWAPSPIAADERQCLQLGQL